MASILTSFLAFSLACVPTLLPASTLTFFLTLFLPYSLAFFLACIREFYLEWHVFGSVCTLTELERAFVFRSVCVPSFCCAHSEDELEEEKEREV